MSKIKAELDVNCFLDNGDERLLKEDPTDRFDTTFWVGDLNFRLDISRIHADWLVAKRDYAQALKFDQLKKVRFPGRFHRSIIWLICPPLLLFLS